MKKTNITDWEQALLQVENFGYGSVKLVVDGINVSYNLGRSKNRLVFMFYVDGKYEGAWSNKESDYGKRFGKPMKPRFTPRIYEDMRIVYGKRYADKEKARLKDFIGAYNPIHPSARSVINVLKKNNLIIELNKNKDE
jgi:hypothetical protein